MAVSFDGIGRTVVTFEADANVTTGSAVKMMANGKVKACDAANDQVVGVCGNVKNGLASVIISGHAKVLYSGSLALGLVNVAADANGKIKTATSDGRQVIVVSMNTGSGVADVIL